MVELKFKSKQKLSLELIRQRANTSIGESSI